MYSVVETAILRGIDGILVSVEADVSDGGLPVFEMVGFLSSEVKEAKERVRIALKNCGYQLPVKRITVNLYPADFKKSGSGFDLPIAIAILCAMKVILQENIDETLVAGEISLSGKILPVNGILPIVDAAKKAKKRRCLVPEANYEEARLVSGIEVYPLKDINHTINLLKEGNFQFKEDRKDNNKICPDINNIGDFGNIKGQKSVKRACEIAMSGEHNILMIGPPGSGKSLIANAIPSILPPLDEEEIMSISKIYSICGMLNAGDGLVMQRPFRMPHHSLPKGALIGGGSVPRPGEISLAHTGVLFLDELTEFDKSVIEQLRMPLEKKKIVINRLGGSYEYPADFVLVAAMSACRCGFFPDMTKCNCTSAAIKSYLSNISQAMLDRFDMSVEVKRPNFSQLISKEKEEDSKDVKERVIAVRNIQKERFKKENFSYNSQIPSDKIAMYCRLEDNLEQYLEDIFTKFFLSPRGYYKLLRVSRTIADMDQSEVIKQNHISEAVCFRGIDKKIWERSDYDI